MNEWNAAQEANFQELVHRAKEQSRACYEKREQPLALPISVVTYQPQLPLQTKPRQQAQPEELREQPKPPRKQSDSAAIPRPYPAPPQQQTRYLRPQKQAWPPQKPSQPLQPQQPSRPPQYDQAQRQKPGVAGKSQPPPAPKPGGAGKSQPPPMTKPGEAGKSQPPSTPKPGEVGKSQPLPIPKPGVAGKSQPPSASKRPNGNAALLPFGLLEKLDNEGLMLMMLLWLLIEEQADSKVILALAYILLV